jgi:glycosyltransferase involved in cell wall biosynthesis
LRTAVVHDWLTGMRGGERVLEEILSLVPEPTIFTLFHFPGSVSARIESCPIRTSFLQRAPGLRGHYRTWLPFFPAAVESFDLTGYDLVVSSSHCVAKGARTPAGVPHLCYCHTPVRYAYDQFDAYFPRDRTSLYALRRYLIGRLRRWDIATAGRVDTYLANSSFVAERIRRHYGREAAVLHPPVDIDFFTPSAETPSPVEAGAPYWLCVSALAPYKRLDRAVDAATESGHRLILVGQGPEEARLRGRAGPSVQFLGTVAREELRELYRHCTAYLQPGEEDFGMAAVEALSCGQPVVARARGGVLDVVSDGVGGILYEDDSVSALRTAIDRASRLRFNVDRLRESALRCAPERFREGFVAAVERVRAERKRPRKGP